MRFCQMFNNFERMICGAVVNDHNLDWLPRLQEGGIDCAPHSLSSIIACDADGNERFGQQDIS